MNCGNPHATGCSEALSRVYEFLDGEVDASVHDQIAQHLDVCPPCRSQYALEQLVKALVKRSCCEASAPEELRIRVVTRIQQVRITYRGGRLG